MCSCCQYIERDQWRRCGCRLVASFSRLNRLSRVIAVRTNFHENGQMIQIQDKIATTASPSLKADAGSVPCSTTIYFCKSLILKDFLKAAKPKQGVIHSEVTPGTTLGACFGRFVACFCANCYASSLGRRSRTRTALPSERGISPGALTLTAAVIPIIDLMW